MSTDRKKTMLVTGASRGIGAQIALLAGSRGFRVGVNYLKSEQAAFSVVEQIKQRGGQAIAIKADVGQADQVEQMFKTLDNAYGALDVLVNNAGILTKFRVEDVVEDDLQVVFRANVYSAYFCSREAVRRMSTKKGGKGGVILNMSSVAVRLGGLGGGAGYAASKAALEAFNLVLAKEVGQEGIRVNAIRPGLIATDIHDLHGGIEQMRELARTAVPMGRAGEALEVAETALWLASDAASYVHASVIDVAGGR
jgi:NAD(P)-dependent dehydrogenase (short-subunit alcohol dehydrogenase family)